MPYVREENAMIVWKYIFFYTSGIEPTDFKLFPLTFFLNAMQFLSSYSYYFLQHFFRCLVGFFENLWLKYFSFNGSLLFRIASSRIPVFGRKTTNHDNAFVFVMFTCKREESPASQHQLRTLAMLGHIKTKGRLDTIILPQKEVKMCFWMCRSWWTTTL